MSFASRLNATFVSDAEERPGHAIPAVASPLRSATVVELTLWAECACGERLALASGFTATCTSEERAAQAAAARGWELAGGKVSCPACLENIRRKELLSNATCVSIGPTMKARPRRETKNGQPKTGVAPLVRASKRGRGLAAEDGAGPPLATKGKTKK